MGGGVKDSCQTNQNKSPSVSTESSDLQKLNAQIGELENQNRQLMEEMKEMKRKKAELTIEQRSGGNFK
jgi:outer membrane murein-binding lipoprotein Lpp